ncbi:hypothetical protein TMatcc_008158 [Talaromyces marneffei ATCC 18224]|uniref:Zn(2)-C6 fungal-type domain-containing protein n=2 Tax=Talaromyces marneffei TaxID=37727 RepID=B6QN91_TALMQ|nr:conserved hypothetical protein [Talaromyces marneffei ATCC 18224]KAE8550164.1 hypothetical protein EYB25_006385 [Talaromyces marneffei]
MDQAVSRRPNVVPAPYGEACTNCARAKYRCTYRPDRRQCERCLRLEKECVTPVSARRLASKHLMESRVVELEEKIESLMALLQNQAAEKSHPHRTSPPAAIGTPTSNGLSHRDRESHDSAFNTDPPNPELAGPVQSDLLAVGESVYQHRSQFDILTSAFEPQPLQAEDCLVYFHSRMLSLFPFVYLRPDMSARQLREWYPFLWVNIMAVTAKHVIGQEVSMTDSIKRFVAQKMVVDNESNLDLLLGLLAFICWFHFHHKGTSYIIVMISLAHSIITDKKLNKMSLETQATTPCSNPPKPSQEAKSMAERRATLAYFLLVSQISYAKKEIDAPEWTPFLDGCLQTLSQSPEWPGDEQLAAQVKMQLLVDQLNRGPWKNQELQPYCSSYLEGLLSQLEKIKAQLPPSLTQNVNITAQLLYSELVIQDAILAKNPVSLYSPNYKWHQLLEAHLKTITHSFDQFFSMQQDQYPAMTFARWCQMAHVLILLHRLFVLNDPSWEARQRVNLFALGDRLVNILAETGASRGGGTPSGADDSIFIRFSRMIKSMCNAWWAELQSPEHRQQSGDRHWQLQGLYPSQNTDPDIVARGGLLAQGGMAASGLVTHQYGMMSDDDWMNEIFNLH